mmetsp:Transcript_14157/g.44647  ORF Transcript_14157/g.44647 Transcript_14157/m.44647 type:complete len:294 (+) Transcript_14157:517-1398(+)
MLAPGRGRHPMRQGDVRGRGCPDIHPRLQVHVFELRLPVGGRRGGGRRKRDDERRPREVPPRAGRHVARVLLGESGYQSAPGWGTSVLRPQARQVRPRHARRRRRPRAGPRRDGDRPAHRPVHVRQRLRLLGRLLPRKLARVPQQHAHQTAHAHAVLSGRSPRPPRVWRLLELRSSQSWLLFQLPALVHLQRNQQLLRQPARLGQLSRPLRMGSDCSDYGRHVPRRHLWRRLLGGENCGEASPRDPRRLDARERRGCRPGEHDLPFFPRPTQLRRASRDAAHTDRRVTCCCVS